MTTIVSAFIANANQRQDRNIDDYIEYGKKLIATDANKIIFIDETILELKLNFETTRNTVIVPVKKTDNYLYAYKEKITNFHLNTTFPEKDTLEYMFTMCHKTEYIRKAIELNPFQSEQFIWVDFGINHIFNNDGEMFNNIISRLNSKKFDNIRIGSIWSPHFKCMNIYKNIAWYFAGGVFGGDTDALIKFADLTKAQCIKTIEENQTLMWEVNIWFLVFLENRKLFSLYSCDHNPSILDNY